MLQVQCAVPRDRATVLAAIRKKWRRRDNDGNITGPAETAHEEFDTFVRTTLVDVLRNSKDQYSRYASRKFSEQFALFFGSQ